MKLGRLVWVTLVCALIGLPLVASAQETTLSGTVRDNTGGVLPGVTVTATNEAQGTTFVGVTDEQGIYRIQLRPGVFRITAELSGFTTVARPGVELLLGRQVNLNLDMPVSGVQETVTVTGEAPLIDTTTSSIGSNIDPRQAQELPLNGRNWLDLAMLAPGSRSNASSEVPQDRQGFFQVAVDGQQQTLTVCCAQNQPRYSRDSIAEFVISTNRFDATQGRTMGMLINAMTKSGTNTPSGTFSGCVPRRPLEREGLHPGPRHPVCESAAQRHLRRADRQGPHSLLRQLGVPARAKHDHLQQPVPDVQHRPSGNPHGKQGRRERRLPVQSAEPPRRCAGTSMTTCIPHVGRRRRGASLDVG